MKRFFGGIILALLFLVPSGLCEELTEGAYTFIEVENGVQIVDCQDVSEVLIIPEELGNMDVVAIGESAFEKNDTAISIAVPEGVLSLAEGAFAECRRLKTVTLPSTLENVSGNPFARSERLVSIFVPEENESFTAIDGALLTKDLSVLITWPNGNPKTIAVLPEGTRVVGDAAFAGNTHIEEVVLPDGAVYIGAGAFENCTSLTHVVLPDTVQSIGTLAFASCKKLTRLTVPGGIYIGMSAFADTPLSMLSPSEPPEDEEEDAEAWTEEEGEMEPEATEEQQEEVTPEITASVVGAEENQEEVSPEMSVTVVSDGEQLMVRIMREGTVNVREEPDAKSKRVATVPANAVYPLVGIAENGWYKILLPSGAQGYVSSRLARIID